MFKLAHWVDELISVVVEGDGLAVAPPVIEGRDRDTEPLRHAVGSEEFRFRPVCRVIIDCDLLQSCQTLLQTDQRPEARTFDDASFLSSIAERGMQRAKAVFHSLDGSKEVLREFSNPMNFAPGILF